MEKSAIPVQLQSHFLRLYQIALTDENFDVLELKMLYKFAEDRGITQDQLNDLLMKPSNYSMVPSTLENKIEHLYDFALMIWADEKVTDEEYLSLKKYCKKFEFLDDNIEALADYLLECAKQQMSLEDILINLNSN